MADLERVITSMTDAVERDSVELGGLRTLRLDRVSPYRGAAFPPKFIDALQVGCEQLRLLCPNELTVPQQFARIAAIAQHEGWSFAFLPDGSVQFGAYTAAKR